MKTNGHSICDNSISQSIQNIAFRLSVLPFHSSELQGKPRVSRSISVGEKAWPVYYSGLAENNFCIFLSRKYLVFFERLLGSSLFAGFSVLSYQLFYSPVFQACVQLSAIFCRKSNKKFHCLPSRVFSEMIKMYWHRLTGHLNNIEIKKETWYCAAFQTVYRFINVFHPLGLNFLH